MLATTRLRLFAALGIAIGILGGTATGIYLANAADPPQATNDQPTKPLNDPVSVASIEKTSTTAANKEALADGGMLSKSLKKLTLGDGGVIVLNDLFDTLEDETELIVRVDIGAFRRLGIVGFNEDNSPFSPNMFMKTIYDTKAILPRKANQLPLRDILSDALAQVAIPSGICTYQVRGSQLVIIPSYQPPSRPGADPLNPPVQLANAEEDVKFISDKMLFEQIYGGVVSVSSEKKLLPEILADLRKQTGANIVLDPRCQPQAQKASLSVSLNDVRLYDVLRIIADMAELKLVYAGNVYYVTTTENAKTFQPPPRPIVYQNPFWPNQLGGGFGGTFPIQNDAIPPMAKQPPAVEQKKP